MLKLKYPERLTPESQQRAAAAAENLNLLTEQLPEFDRREEFLCIPDAAPEPAVSVVVPVYNAEKYLFRFFSSLQRQTLPEQEIIFVDDASSDRSPQILKFFALIDARVKVLTHTENLSAGAARNTGLAAASGTYLFFADPDDWCAPELLAALTANARRNNADLVLFNVDAIDTASGECTWRAEAAKWVQKAGKPFSRHDFPKLILTATTPAPWNKFLRRSFVSGQQLQFQALRNTNDLLFSTLALALAERITFEPTHPLYWYRRNTPGGLQNTRHDSPGCVLDALLAVIRELKRRGVYDEIAASVSSLVQIKLTANLLKRPFRGPAFEIFYREVREKFLPEIRELTPLKPEFEFLLQTVAANQYGSDFLLNMIVFYQREINKYTLKIKKLTRGKTVAASGPGKFPSHWRRIWHAIRRYSGRN